MKIIQIYTLPMIKSNCVNLKLKNFKNTRLFTKIDNNVCKHIKQSSFNHLKVKSNKI